MRKVLWLLIVGAGLLSACARRAATVSKTTTDINRYQEDLSGVRPRYPVAGAPPSSIPAEPATAVPPPTVPGSLPKTQADVTRRVNAALDTLATRNHGGRMVPGFRVQIYVGNDRQEAEAAKTGSYQLFPDLTPYVMYVQPSYRVKVGDFADRLEAEHYYAGLKAAYPSAIVVPDKIDVRRNLAQYH